LDTLATLLLHLYDSSSDYEKGLFLTDIPFLAEQFAQIDNREPSTWTTVKTNLIRQGYSDGDLIGAFGNFISIVRLKESFEELCMNPDATHVSEYLIQHVREEFTCHTNTFGADSKRGPFRRQFGRDWHVKGCTSFQQCINTRNYLPTCVKCTALDDRGELFPTRIPHKVNGIGPIQMLGFIYKMV